MRARPLCISGSVSVRALAVEIRRSLSAAKRFFPLIDLYYVSRPWVGSWLSRLCVCEWERVGFWLNTSINGKGIRERLSPLSSPHRPVGETWLRLDLGMRRDGGRAAYLILSKKSPPPPLLSLSLSLSHTHTHTNLHEKAQADVHKHTVQTHMHSLTHTHTYTL